MNILDDSDDEAVKIESISVLHRSFFLLLESICVTTKYSQGTYGPKASDNNPALLVFTLFFHDREFIYSKDKESKCMPIKLKSDSQMGSVS